jgi:hypothetical protein
MEAASCASSRIATLLLASVMMGLAVAHALEFPGKLPLDEATYDVARTAPH